MKAYTLVRHGAADRAFELREHAGPKPGPGQVLIRSEGFGLNYADTMAVKGLYREAPPIPSVIGYEVVGRVEQLGDQVPQDLLGKRVAALTRFGGYAQLAVTDHRACIVIGEEMTLGVAAALTTQGVTAWYAARVLSPLRAGERVLVHSAAGGVGHLIVELAVRSGCEVFGIVGGKEKAAFVRGLGAAHVIDRHAGDPAAQLRHRFAKNRLDASFNAVGGSTFRTDLSLLNGGGRLVLFGGAERGAVGMFGTLRFVWRMGLVLPIFLMMKSRSLLGINMLRIAERRQDLIAECLRGETDAHREGWLRPHVHGSFAHDQLPEALNALESGRTMGKVVVAW